MNYALRGRIIQPSKSLRPNGFTIRTVVNENGCSRPAGGREHESNQFTVSVSLRTALA